MTRLTPRPSPVWCAVAFVLAASLGGCVPPLPPPGYYGYGPPGAGGPYPAYGAPPVADGPYPGGGWGYRPWR